jgi:endonuclease I
MLNNFLYNIYIMIKIIFLLLISTNIMAQIPNNYYNTCIGNSGNNLKNKLHNITLATHNAIGYAAVWGAFETTDVKSNGKVWDIYSYNYFGGQPYEYVFGIDQCGQYNTEGDCYNREHSWPQSKFISNEPMKSDLHHVMASDGFINGIHSDNPYGNVTVVNKTTLQGAKSGTSTSYTSYSGDVFEPIDSFKGDVARAYFYMATRYLGEDADWLTWEMASGADLTADAIKVLLAWHRLDPVSKKEIDRNNAIYSLQGNRNPFVDSAIFVECIWGGMFCGNVAITNHTAEAFSITQSNQEIIIDTPNDTSPIQYQIINMMGQIINTNNTSVRAIAIKDLPSGMYCLQINAKSQTKTFRFTH